MLVKRRVNLSIDELTCNVKKLIQHVFSIPNNIAKGEEEEDDTPILVWKAIKMYFEGEGEGEDEYLKTSWTGHVTCISTVHIINTGINF